MDRRHTKYLTVNQEELSYHREGRAQMTTSLMTDIPEESLDVSTAFTNAAVDYFAALTVKIGQGNKSDGVVCSHV